jgi:hypothetical protein
LVSGSDKTSPWGWAVSVEKCRRYLVHDKIFNFTCAYVSHSK